MVRNVNPIPRPMPARRRGEGYRPPPIVLRHQRIILRREVLTVAEADRWRDAVHRIESGGRRDRLSSNEVIGGLLSIAAAVAIVMTWMAWPW